MKIIKELTPKSMSCGPVAGCPAIFKTDNDSYVVIGKKVQVPELAQRIGRDEALIEVSAGLIDQKLP